MEWIKQMKYIISICMIFVALSVSAFAADKELKDYYIKFTPKFQSKVSEIAKTLGKEKGINLQALIPAAPKSDKLLSTKSANSLSRIYKITNVSFEELNYLSNNLEYEYIEEIPEMQIFERPNDFMLSQQYYLDSMNIYAVWDLVDTTQEVVIGIVDTGVELDHEDLKDKIWHNKGEMGTDGNGNPKQSNGIDDDGNGYIDDWQGWDFYGASGDQDNDPMPGKDHGTHVAGIAAGSTNNFLGIAGVAPHAKILAVKAGPDDPTSNSISNGYQGILYAAMMGADVINCSFGGGGYSQTEAEIIAAAQDYGALIVAAAGNDYVYAMQYPASYPGVISVASLEQTGNKASYSNYGPDVDICAFGSAIFSTITGNDYGTKSGTSMATPVLAGVVALVKSNFPKLSNEELSARLKATADNHFDNDYLKGCMGRGEVNPMRALTADNLAHLEITNIDMDYRFNPFGDNKLDTVYLSFTAKNILDPLTNVKFSISVRNLEVEYLIDDVTSDILHSKAYFSSANELGFVLPDNLETDQEVFFYFNIEADGAYTDSKLLKVIVNPSYLNMDHNNITTTFNSDGNIGYNDYSQNLQGSGMLFNHYQYLFEGAIIAGVSETNISNNARGSSGSAKNRSFKQIERFSKSFISDDILYGFTSYTDKYAGKNTNIHVDQEVYQSKAADLEDLILVRYKISAADPTEVKSLYFGQFYDWDLSINGGNDMMKYNTDYDFAYAEDLSNTDLAKVYLKNLSPYNNNFYAINNSGNDGSFSIYDGFSEVEKWLAISSDLAKIETKGSDCSMVLAAGPIDIAIGDTADIIFAITFAHSVQEAVANFDKGKLFAGSIDGFNLQNNSIADIMISPNPASDNIEIKLGLLHSIPVHLAIYDAQGKLVKTLINNKILSAGIHILSTNVKELSQGKYFLHLRADKGNITSGFMIIR